MMCFYCYKYRVLWHIYGHIYGVWSCLLLFWIAVHVIFIAVYVPNEPVVFMAVVFMVSRDICITFVRTGRVPYDIYQCLVPVWFVYIM